jgi:hypothetical protein
MISWPCCFWVLGHGSNHCRKCLVEQNCLPRGLMQITKKKGAAVTVPKRAHPQCWDSFSLGPT